MAMGNKDSLRTLARIGKEFGELELADQKKALVQLKAQKAIATLKNLGISDTVEQEALSLVMRLAQEQRAKALEAAADAWDHVLHTVGMAKYYVAQADGQEPTLGDEDDLASDMDEDTLRIVIAPKLDIPYLQPTTAPPVWQNNTVSGILWGFQSRPFYALTVSTSQGQVLAPFFSDSGSAGNYLNEGTFAALGWSGHIPDTATVRIHGYSTLVALACGRFKGINTIGADFKSVVGGIETLDYTQDLVQLRCALFW